MGVCLFHDMNSLLSFADVQWNDSGWRRQVTVYGDRGGVSEVQRVGVACVVHGESCLQRAEGGFAGLALFDWNYHPEAMVSEALVQLPMALVQEMVCVVLVGLILTHAKEMVSGDLGEPASSHAKEMASEGLVGLT
jgi:hypothetical protein